MSRSTNRIYAVINAHNKIDKLATRLLRDTERCVTNLRDNFTLPTASDVNELNEKLGSIMGLPNDQYYDKRREISNKWESKYVTECMYGFAEDPRGNYQKHMRYALQRVVMEYKNVFDDIDDIMYYIGTLKPDELEALEVIIRDNYADLSRKCRSLNAINRTLYYEFGQVDIDEIEGMLRKFIDEVITVIEEIPTLIFGNKEEE